MMFKKEYLHRKSRYDTNSVIGAQIFQTWLECSSKDIESIASPVTKMHSA